MSDNRKRYTPRLSIWPIKAVRGRSYPHRCGEEVRLFWRLFLFGVVPIARLPRRSREAAK